MPSQPKAHSETLMPSQSQIEFQRADAGRTQNEKLRDHLTQHPRQWVAMPELAKVITPTGIGAAVHSRVNDCRRVFNMHIEKRRRRVDGTWEHDYFFDPELPSNFGCQRKRKETSSL